MIISRVSKPSAGIGFEARLLFCHKPVKAGRQVSKRSRETETGGKKDRVGLHILWIRGKI